MMADIIAVVVLLAAAGAILLSGRERRRPDLFLPLGNADLDATYHRNPFTEPLP